MTSKDGNRVPPASLGRSPARKRHATLTTHAEHERICLDPNAHNLRHTYVLPAQDNLT